MKNNGKNHSNADSLNAGEAAAMLGVSIPTLKRMAAENRVESFRTPGGHLRILAESIEAVRERRQAPARTVRDAFPALQNRRERLEELTLETHEHRARRELEKERREAQEETDRREAEAQARKEEAAQRERLESERAQERRGQERERAQEQARCEAEQELAAFRQRWYDAAAEAVATLKLTWLTPGQRKEVTEALEAEIERRQPADEPRMGAIIARSLEALVEPLRSERDARERRQKAAEGALRELPTGTTEAERVRATAAVREAVSGLDQSADVSEMRVAADEAVGPVRQAVERRLRDARLLTWTVWQLPWGKIDRDEARVRRECSEILAELPDHVSEVEAKEALEPTIREARQEIEQRQAEQQRQVRKSGLIQQGIQGMFSYLLTLKADGEISPDDLWDSGFNGQLRDAVHRQLDAELAGDETSQQVQTRTREIIDEEIA